MNDDIFAEAIGHWNDLVILLRKHTCRELISWMAETMVQKRSEDACDSPEWIPEDRTVIEELPQAKMIPLAISKLSDTSDVGVFSITISHPGSLVSLGYFLQSNVRYQSFRGTERCYHRSSP
jgi:hypothetical protein